MPRLLFLFVLMSGWGITATLYAASKGILTGFNGAFLRTLVGYGLALIFAQIIFLVLPKLGLGNSSEN